MSAGPSGDRRRTNDERREESAERLRRALATLICEQGYRVTTNAQIGERAGFSRNMVRDRFGSKEKLLLDLLLRAAGAMAVETTPESTGLDRALRAYDQLRQYAEAEPINLRAVMITIFQSSAPDDPIAVVVRDVLKGLRETFITALAEGIADGSVRGDLDVERESSLVRTQALGIFFDCAAGLGTRPLPARMTELLDRIRSRFEADATAP